MTDRPAKSRLTFLVFCAAVTLVACGKSDDIDPAESAAADASAPQALLPHQQMAKDILKDLVESDHDLYREYNSAG